MIIDFHTHIFPKDIRQNREKYYQNEPDFHLLYHTAGSKLIGAQELVRTMDRQGVDRAVICGFAWKTPDTLQKQNEYIMQAVQRYPGRLIGFCAVDPDSDRAVAETVRCFEGGLSGIGELASYFSGIEAAVLKKLDPIMEICRQTDRPVLIHTNEPIGHYYPGKAPMTLKQIYAMIQRFPGNKIVLAHWGGGLFFFNLMKKEAKETFKNVYFDTAASPLLYDPLIYKIAIQILGKEKILFGSDFPLIAPERYFKELESAGLSAVEKDHINYLNAARLLKLSPGGQKGAIT